MSEFTLIGEYFSRHTLEQGIGVGDDCAVFLPPADHELVICTDTFISGRHFPADTPAHAIGHKAVAVNLSDLAAMGALPHSILLALSLPNVDRAWLAEFSDRLYGLCERFGVRLIGGDTTKSPTLSISVTALGFVKQGSAIGRTGAREGDVICVSGSLGGAAFALAHPQSPLQHTLDYPYPQVALGQKLLGYASSMIDVSDGLAQDLGHILSASGVSGELYLDKIPLQDELQALEFDTAMQYALCGGDDYELCFSIAPDALVEFCSRYPDSVVYPIGKITNTSQESSLICHYHHQRYPINTKGFDHFA